MALVKGTADYKKAQALANELTELATMERNSGNNHYFIGAKCDLDIFIDKIAKLSCFAAQVAETVNKSLSNPYGYTLANISDKQAWILACAAVENNITL